MTTSTHRVGVTSTAFGRLSGHHASEEVRNKWFISGRHDKVDRSGTSGASHDNKGRHKNHTQCCTITALDRPSFSTVSRSRSDGVYPAFKPDWRSTFEVPIGLPGRSIA